MAEYRLGVQGTGQDDSVRLFDRTWHERPSFYPYEIRQVIGGRREARLARALSQFLPQHPGTAEERERSVDRAYFIENDERRVYVADDELQQR